MIDHGCICLIIFSPLSIVKLAVQSIVAQFKATNTFCQYYLTSPPFLYLTPLPSPSFSLSHTSSLSLLFSISHLFPLPPSLSLSRTSSSPSLPQTCRQSEGSAGQRSLYPRCRLCTCCVCGGTFASPCIRYRSHARAEIKNEDFKIRLNVKMTIKLIEFASLCCECLCVPLCCVLYRVILHRA
jgi:hypothetical protein